MRIDVTVEIEGEDKPALVAELSLHVVELQPALVAETLLFIILVGALALIVLSLLRRTPRHTAARQDADEATGEQRALPAPAGHIEHSLGRATTMHFFHELALGDTLQPNVPAEHVRVAMVIASTLQAIGSNSGTRRGGRCCCPRSCVRSTTATRRGASLPRP